MNLNVKIKIFHSLSLAKWCSFACGFLHTDMGICIRKHFHAQTAISGMQVSKSYQLSSY